jgi:hypothetical protein
VVVPLVTATDVEGKADPAQISQICAERSRSAHGSTAAPIGGYRAMALTRNHYGVRLICLSLSEPCRIGISIEAIAI